MYCTIIEPVKEGLPFVVLVYLENGEVNAVPCASAVEGAEIIAKLQSDIQNDPEF